MARARAMESLERLAMVRLTIFFPWRGGFTQDIHYDSPASSSTLSMLTGKNPPTKTQDRPPCLKRLRVAKLYVRVVLTYSGYRGTVCPNWTRTDLWGGLVGQPAILPGHILVL